MGEATPSQDNELNVSRVLFWFSPRRWRRVYTLQRLPMPTSFVLQHNSEQLSKHDEGHHTLTNSSSMKTYSVDAGRSPAARYYRVWGNGFNLYVCTYFACDRIRWHFAQGLSSSAVNQRPRGAKHVCKIVCTIQWLEIATSKRDVCLEYVEYVEYLEYVEYVEYLEQVYVNPGISR